MKPIPVGTATLEIMRGDLANQPDMDAVVNAANASLTGGGGVDGALHRAAGPKLKEASAPRGPIAPGEAVITPAFELPNQYVIHCLGPVYGQDQPEDELLAACYRNALQLAENEKIISIAFPAISCGVFGYPMKEATGVVLQTLKEQAPRLNFVKTIRIVLWSDDAMRAYEEAIDVVFGGER